MLEANPAIPRAIPENSTDLRQSMTQKVICCRMFLLLNVSSWMFSLSFPDVVWLEKSFRSWKPVILRSKDHSIVPSFSTSYGCLKPSFVETWDDAPPPPTVAFPQVVWCLKCLLAALCLAASCIRDTSAWPACSPG